MPSTLMFPLMVSAPLASKARTPPTEPFQAREVRAAPTVTVVYWGTRMSWAVFCPCVEVEGPTA